MTCTLRFEDRYEANLFYSMLGTKIKNYFGGKSMGLNRKLNLWEVHFNFYTGDENPYE